MKAVAVRSAMIENIGHLAKQGAVDFATSSKVENTRYAAHFL
jgi:ATP-dependent phosphoenolpyruvate carboxykinase